MLFARHGDPEESEFVICTVTKVQHHSVFVHVNEYDYSGMIHISEIAPGRIRNIRDYVKEDKVVVCKVLRVNPEKRQVDLSLRRASEIQKRQKINEMKHEQKAETIVEHVAKEHKLDFKELYNRLAEKIFPHYEYFFMCFEQVVENNLKLTSLGIEEKMAGYLEEVIRQRIKPKEVRIGGVLTAILYEPDGVEIIRDALTHVQKPELTVTYLGGGRYKVSVIAKDYKQAEPILKEYVDDALASIKKAKGVVTFDRDSK